MMKVYSFKEKEEKKYQELLVDVVSGLMETLKVKDVGTYEHSVRVAQYAVFLGRAMKLSQDELTMLELGALFHDLGKIGVPDHILDKPGKLTEAERAQIELHPGRGAEMLEPLRFLHRGLAILKNHHERYDGSGYPDSLAGENIPFVARIVSVADAFDAMTTDRSYRKAMSLQEALAEIKKQKGTQFDPHCADVFLDIVKEEAT